MKDINLSWEESNGLKSLKKKIKEGKLVVAQTDKSSRLAVMSVEQYVNAGKEHTKKDLRIDWAKVTYLQNQVNSHVWWIGNILGYCNGTDSKRMMRNLQDHV